MNKLFRKLTMAALVATLSTTAFAASSNDGKGVGFGEGYSQGSSQGLAPEDTKKIYVKPRGTEYRVPIYIPVRRVVERQNTTCDSYYNAITQNNMTVTVPLYNECLRRGGY